MAWRAEDVLNRVEALRSRQRREVPERTSSPHRSDTPRQDDTRIRGRSRAVGNQDDARTHWIDWDGHGERYKAWRTVVCRDSRQLDHAGLGLGGEGTALHMAKMMERQGGDPRLSAERWLREKGIERDSRTRHELSVLTNALHQGGTCDQLNVGGLGCLEVICRRIVVLVEAHRQPSRPNWTAARYLEGASMSEEVILPGLRSYAMRRAKEEVEIQNAQQRSYTRSSANGDDNDVGDGKGANKKASRACPLGARWMILLDAAPEMARLLPWYQEP